MNILEHLLNQFIEVPQNLYELTNKHIIEVDDYLSLLEANQLTIGYVKTCENHPNSDHLHVTTVDVGTEVLQIVCGASNVRAGQTVIVATPGTVLPGNFEIKKSVIRGIESFGMICSLKELGFDEKYIPAAFSEGIYYFDETIKPGSDTIKVLGLLGKKLILGMTTNRGDLLSHLGFAYDLAAVLNKKVNISVPTIKPSSHQNPLTVKIETDGCFKYDARVLEVKIKESPWWLKNALIQSDIRPINNVVDITNYILIMYGTPLHAFDYQKVDSHEIMIRSAKNNERIVTLDEQERILASGDVVITNGKKPIALGGVMGLLNTVIDNQTTKIILEAALFDPKRIAETSKRLDLKSDSSLRFERGIEFERIRLGLEKATELLVELADGVVYNGIASAFGIEPKPVVIKTSYERLNKHLGTNLSKDTMKSILSRLSYQVDDKKDLKVVVPDYRKDISIEADLVEEIARIYGYDNIPHHRLQIEHLGGFTKEQKHQRTLRHLLANLGLNEVINYSITGTIDDFPKIGETIGVLMPMAEDKKYLRQSLMPGLLSSISYHQSRQMNDLGFFEMGHVFAKNLEVNHLAVALSGTWIHSEWLKRKLNGDYYILKGILELIGETFDVPLYVAPSTSVNALHPGIQGTIMLKDQKIGTIGRIHPKTEAGFDVKDVYAFELDLSLLLKHLGQTSYEAVSRFPSVTRDISFIIDEIHPIADVLQLIQQTARKIIHKVELFDVYRGTNVKEGHQSLAVSITFQNKEKTFEKDDIEKALKSIKNRLNFAFKAEVRD